MSRRGVRAFRVPMAWGAAVAGFLAPGPAFCDSAAIESAAHRVIVRLPESAHPAPLVPYTELTQPARPRVPHAATLGTTPPLRRAGELLDAHGAAAFASLDDGLAVAPAEWGGRFVVEFDPPLSRAAAHALVDALRGAAPELEAEVDGVCEILAAPGVDWAAGQSAPARGALAAEQLGAFPDDPLFVDGSQWGLANVGVGPWSAVPGLDVRVLDAWARTTGATNLRVGVVDTGIDPSHPDLVRLLADGQSRLQHRSVVRPDGSFGVDSLGHGTQIWGVVAALTHNGASAGGLGMAGVVGGAGGDSAGARLISIKATVGRGTTASDSDLARAIVDAQALGARVINLSFASSTANDILRSAVSFAAENGVLVVCGAGNSADSRLQYPASYSRFGLTVSVGALAPDGSLAVFSTRGDQVDLVAPGENIHTTWLTYANAFGSPLRDYAVNSGTSFAAPLVTGAVALALEQGATLYANDYQEVLRSTARDWGAPGRDSLFGSGILDAGELLRRLAPPSAFERGTASARSWSYVGSESLHIRSSGLSRGGQSLDGDYLAEVWEVRARVEGLPGFLEPPAAWVRFSGDGGWSRGSVHEYNYSWGEPVAGTLSESGFELSTFVYFVASGPTSCTACPPVGWVPRSPDRIRLDWTAWGRLDAAPSLVVLEPAPNAAWAGGLPHAVRWTATDPDQVTRVELWWDAGGISTLLASVEGPVSEWQVTAPCQDGSGSATLRVVAIDANGPVVDQSAVSVPLAVSGAVCSTDAAVLHGPLANPARGSAQFEAWLPAEAAGGVLRILDPRGREVTRLPAAGSVSPLLVAWDGTGRDGARAPSGIYFAVLEAGSSRSVQRFVWLR